MFLLLFFANLCDRQSKVIVFGEVATGVIVFCLVQRVDFIRFCFLCKNNGSPHVIVEIYLGLNSQLCFVVKVTQYASQLATSFITSPSLQTNIRRN